MDRAPDAFPTSLRAELWAVLQMLQLALPPLRIYVDNKGVVDGWRRGRTWCCAASRPAADLWSQIWHKLLDIGTEGIEICKCKGHATEADVLEGRSTPFLRKGNDHADHFAGRGVEVAEAMSPSGGDAEAYRRALRWYKWLAVLAAHWPDDTQRPGARPSPRPPEMRVGPAPLVLHADHPHDLFEDGGSLACRGCPRRVGLSSSLQLRRILAGSACLRSVGERARVCNDSAIGVAGLAGLGHQLFLSGKLVWCKRCGCYGEMRFQALRRPCLGTALGGRATLLQRLLHGLHPVSRAPLAAAIRCAS